MSSGRRLSELAKVASARLVGDGDPLIGGVATLEDAGPEDISLFHHPRYRDQFLATQAAAVVVRGDALEMDGRPRCALLVSSDPYLSFAKVARLFHALAGPKPGCDPRAHVDPLASVDPGAEVRAFAFVASGASVGAGTVLHPFSHVGEGARVGAGCELHAGAVVERGCILGNRVILHAGAVVGSDGFGYAFDGSPSDSGNPPGVHLKVPQIGIARVEDDVEIGANSCVDRAAMGETVIGRGSKIDNLVQVGHNVRIGPLSILCGQAGIAGSARLGAMVMVGGQAGIVGHGTVGDGAKIGAQAGVMNEVPAGETWSGAPALPHSRWLRQTAAERQIMERLKQLADLEKRLQALEEDLARPKG